MTGIQSLLQHIEYEVRDDKGHVTQVETQVKSPTPTG